MLRNYNLIWCKDKFLIPRKHFDIFSLLVSDTGTNMPLERGLLNHLVIETCTKPVTTKFQTLSIEPRNLEYILPIETP